MKCARGKNINLNEWLVTAWYVFIESPNGIWEVIRRAISSNFFRDRYSFRQCLNQLWLTDPDKLIGVKVSEYAQYSIYIENGQWKRSSLNTEKGLIRSDQCKHTQTWRTLTEPGTTLLMFIRNTADKYMTIFKINTRSTQGCNYGWHHGCSPFGYFLFKVKLCRMGSTFIKRSPLP